MKRNKRKSPATKLPRKGFQSAPTVNSVPETAQQRFERAISKPNLPDAFRSAVSLRWLHAWNAAIMRIDATLLQNEIVPTMEEYQEIYRSVAHVLTDAFAAVVEYFNEQWKTSKISSSTVTP